MRRDLYWRRRWRGCWFGEWRIKREHLDEGRSIGGGITLPWHTAWTLGSNDVYWWVWRVVPLRLGGRNKGKQEKEARHPTLRKVRSESAWALTNENGSSLLMRMLRHLSHLRSTFVSAEWSLSEALYIHVPPHDGTMHRPGPEFGVEIYRTLPASFRRPCSVRVDPR